MKKTVKFKVSFLALIIKVSPPPPIKLRLLGAVRKDEFLGKSEEAAVSGACRISGPQAASLQAQEGRAEAWAAFLPCPQARWAPSAWRGGDGGCAADSSGVLAAGCWKEYVT